MAEDEVLVVNADPDGDLFLELSLPDGKTRLLVSSKVLTLVSDVFAKMLSSRFKEGLRTHATSEKPLIPLSEDDAEAFIILCKVIHHHMDEVPRTLTPTCLEKIAIICDKYNCTRALAHSSMTWLQAGIETSVAKDFNKLLFAAYVLDIPDAFSRISWEILVVQVGPFFNLPGLTDQDLVSHDLLGISRKLKEYVDAVSTDSI